MIGRTLRAMVLGVMMSALVTTMAFAEYVYVTKNGKKYHHAESRFVKGKENVEKITLDEAEERGLEPSRSYIRYKAQIEEEQETKKTSTKKKKKK